AALGAGTAASGAAVAAFGSAVDADVVEPGSPSCRAVGVVAELGKWVHRRVPRGTIWRSCPLRCSMDPRLSTHAPPSRFPGVLPALCRTVEKKGSLARWIPATGVPGPSSTRSKRPESGHERFVELI